MLPNSYNTDRAINYTAPCPECGNDAEWTEEVRVFGGVAKLPTIEILCENCNDDKRLC